MGINTIETKTLKTCGRVVVSIAHEIDTDPDTSWLGEFSGYQEPRTKSQKLVHLASGLVLDHHGIWRDERGRIAAEPEEYRHSRDYEYTFHNNGHEKIKYALQDSRRLEDINNGNIGFIGIVATVTLDGVEIGHDSLWGIESDSGNAHIESVERECAWMALREAKEWRVRNIKVA